MMERFSILLFIPVLLVLIVMAAVAWPFHAWLAWAPQSSKINRR